MFASVVIVFMPTLLIYIFMADKVVSGVSQGRFERLMDFLQFYDAVRAAAQDCCRFVFAVCIIGYERESRNKGAGIRTHAIVSLAAALIMIVSKYGFSDIPDYRTLPVLQPSDCQRYRLFWERELYL